MGGLVKEPRGAMGNKGGGSQRSGSDFRTHSLGSGTMRSRPRVLGGESPTEDPSPRGLSERKTVLSWAHLAAPPPDLDFRGTR